MEKENGIAVKVDIASGFYWVTFIYDDEVFIAYYDKKLNTFQLIGDASSYPIADFELLCDIKLEYKNVLLVGV